MDIKPVSWQFDIHRYHKELWKLFASQSENIRVFATPFTLSTTSVKKNTESPVMILRNDVLILNGKENKEASAICFEIRIPKKKNKELLLKVPSKIYEVISLWKKTKKKMVC